jgi:hypothetical protein
MKIYPKIYVDEAGNTGSNVCDNKQKYFVLSAVSFTDDELEKIQKDINYPKELHFFKMKQSIDGRNAIKTFLSHPLIYEKHVTYEFVDKAFCICAQIVDMTIEPVIHFIYKDNLYKKKGNIILANCLYAFFAHHKNNSLINEFKISFMTMMREQTKDNIKKFYSLVHRLLKSPDTNKSLACLLHLIGKSSFILPHVLVEDNKYSLDTTLTSLLVMIDHWYGIYQKELDIITDNSKQFDAQRNWIRRLSSIKVKQEVGYDTRKHTYPIPLHSFEMVDSQTSFGVQVADMVASAVAFRWNETTPKYQAFQDEIAQMDFFSIPCHPLRPASEEELSESVDSSEDIDPLEFLAHHLD